MSRNGEEVMEENDHIEEPHQGQFIDGTPSREVLLRVNNNNDSSIIGDSTSVNPCAQNSLRMILDEIKSLKSQMNLLQNQVKPTSDDKRLTDQNNVRFGINTMYEDEHTHNAYQPYRTTSMPNSYDEPRNYDYSRTSSSYPTTSRSSINHRNDEFRSTMHPFENIRERTHDRYEHDVPYDGYLRRGPEPEFRRTHESKGRKPATFDGAMNWNDYIVHFDMIAELNYWSDETKALELATSLRGPALSVLSDLRPEYRYSFRHLVSALSSRFEPENQAEIYKTQLKSRVRRKNESITELMQDIKRLVRMAYPNAPLDFRDQITKDSFIESLNEQEMEWSVFQGRPRNLEDAVRLSLEYEAFQQARGRRNRVAVRMQREEPTDTNNRNDAHQIALISQNTEKKFNKKGPCFYCKKDGHIKSECRLLQRHLEAEKNKSQRKSGHTNSVATKAPENQENVQ